MQPIDRLAGTENRKDRISSKQEPIKVTRMKLLQLQHEINQEMQLKNAPDLQLRDRRLLIQYFHQSQRLSGSNPRRLSQIKFKKIPKTETHNQTHMPDSKQKIDVGSQTSPIREISSQVSGSNTEPVLRNQTGSTLV